MPQRLLTFITELTTQAKLTTVDAAQQLWIIVATHFLLITIEALLPGDQSSSDRTDEWNYLDTYCFALPRFSCHPAMTCQRLDAAVV